MAKELDELTIMVKAPMRILIYINYLNVVKKENQISRTLNITPNQVCRVIQRFKKTGLVVTERKSRMTQMTLTNKGRKIAENLRKINQVMIK